MSTFVKELTFTNGLCDGGSGAQVDSLSMTPTGIVSGSYGGSGLALALSVDTAGRILSLSTFPISGTPIGQYALSGFPTSGVYALSGYPTSGVYALSGFPASGVYQVSGTGGATPTGVAYLASGNTFTVGQIIQTDNTASGALTLEATSLQAGPLFTCVDASGNAYVTVGPPNLASDISKHLLSVTGTLGTGSCNALLNTLTTATGATGFQIGLNTLLQPGYTGTGIVVGVECQCNVAGTGNNLNLGVTASEVNGNTGFAGFSFADTTGLNVGVWGEAEESTTLNIGVGGKSTTNIGGATNIGVAGFSHGGASPLAGYFGLHNSTPTFPSAALCADNGTTPSPILLARANGAPQVAIGMSGALQAGLQGPLATTASDGFLYIPTCSGTPTGTPINLSGCIPIQIDATHGKLYLWSHASGAWIGAQFT